jgi:hypothetical protein
MTDARAHADDAVLHLDRLGAVILDDIGEGPAPQDLVARASEAREAVAKVGIAAFNEVTGLVVGVARSIAAGATDWSPSLGGTLMAAVDDLRTLIMRAAQFSSEDSEHLHQRAADLAAYVHVAAEAPATPVEPVPPATVPPSLPEPAATVSAQMPSATASSESPASPPEPSVPAPSPAAASPVSKVVPISDLFYAEGPQVVSGGVPPSANAKSDLLGVGIEALENLTAQPFAAQSSTGPMVIVPVDTLLYRGRAALERAAAIREQIKASGAQASPAALDEMYDLIGLALKD